MPERAFIAFVCRQAPDWRALSEDYRRGIPINPSRYVPSHPIPGFPNRIDLLISQWNKRFSIDFFSFRHVLAELSKRSIAGVENHYRFSYGELTGAAELGARAGGFVYFHDDDDFFAPHLASIVGMRRDEPDALVTPMFRIGTDAFTFVRDGCTPDVLCGPPRPHDFRYQTNNYGIASRHCQRVEQLRALKDHVFASFYADKEGFRDEILPFVVSATVKTPGSASMLPVIFRSEQCLVRSFELVIATLHTSLVPPWLSRPLHTIATLVERVYRGESCDLAQLLGESPASANPR
jgi:hypothetical protein